MAWNYKELREQASQDDRRKLVAIHEAGHYLVISKFFTHVNATITPIQSPWNEVFWMGECRSQDSLEGGNLGLILSMIGWSGPLAELHYIIKTYGGIPLLHNLTQNTVNNFIFPKVYAYVTHDETIMKEYRSDLEYINKYVNPFYSMRLAWDMICKEPNTLRFTAEKLEVHLSITNFTDIEYFI